ncbi:TPA: hypothetical protein ACKRQV_006645 [Pseudomonas aeruginosa]|nr:hypothetical protein [Pseudomonas aeruginosa]EIU2864227.1 hypothetical protein [Pseudomonas aeruginosa]
MNGPQTYAITAGTLQEMQKGSDKGSRALRDLALSLSRPQVYDFNLRRFSDLTEQGFGIAVGLLRDFRAGTISQDDLDEIAALLESSIDQSNTCLDRVGGTSIRVVIAKQQVGTVSTKAIGLDNAEKKARWIRDNYLFDNQGQITVKKRRSPRKGVVKRITLVSDMQAKGLSFLVTYQGASGRPTTKRFSAVKLGFDGAFRAALAKAKEAAPDIDLKMNNPYRPTNEEYNFFKQIVPDLPEPEAC